MKDKHQYIKDWLKKADSDLKIARGEMMTNEPAADAVCFHFQQAVEKLLKAWLIYQEKKFPLTHNIEVLLVACEGIDSSFAAIRIAENLTPYAVEIRYADDYYFPTDIEMKEAERIASLVENFIKSKISLS